MLGTSRLLVFGLRAVVSLLTLSILWTAVASRYSSFLAAAADALVVVDVGVRAVGALIAFDAAGLAEPVTIDGLTLHFGLILLLVLVLSAVGLGALERSAWLGIVIVGAAAVHVLGVTALAYGVAWVAPGGSDRLVLSLFAVFWGLIPAVAGGAWTFLYWLPRASSQGE